MFILLVRITSKSPTPVSDSQFEVPRAALRERYSSPPATSTSDNTSALTSQPTTPMLALFSIPSTPSLLPAEPPSTIASTSTTSKKGQSVELLLVILTSSINILVLYLLVLVAIYL